MLRNIGTLLNKQIRSVVVPTIRNYESDISLKALYPASNLKLTSPSPPPPVIVCFLLTQKPEKINENILLISASRWKIQWLHPNERYIRNIFTQ